MLFVVLFEDNPGGQDLRTKYLADHLAFLERHADQVQAAGPLKDASTQQARGGLWLIEASDMSAVQVLVEADPFWSIGLRKTVQYFEWTQVFAAGQKLIDTL